MGQATVDLPDPLETLPKGVGGADDLLAQMAGDEIDRLLAEAEADLPTVAKAPAPDIAGDLPGWEGAAKANPPAAGLPAIEPPSASIPASESEDALAGELDSLLESLTTASPRPSDSTVAPAPSAIHAIEAEQAAAIPAVESPAVTSGETAALLSAAAEEAFATGELTSLGEEATAAAERLALGAPTTLATAIAPDPAQAAIEDISEQQLAGEDAPLPLLLRPLEWINAPLNACPDLLREFIGKAAILTAVNAAAIMFYVRFIRRH